MLTVIVFSKDRPMQLDAYLGSFLTNCIDNSDISIFVLYKESPDISYKKVIHKYPNVNWISENNFNEQLKLLIENVEAYILFGCDDVVFVSPFNLTNAIEVLESKENVLGVSLRLGTNIRPLPKNKSVYKNYYLWNWKDCIQKHYNYPWELDCTVYRKNDVTDLINNYGEGIISPNFFESAFAIEPNKYFDRALLACERSVSKAIVITVNRVQDTHCNPVDETDITDVYNLSRLYNEFNIVLDLKKISVKKSNKIHVDSSYFILSKNDIVVTKDNKRIRKKLKNLIKNIIFLTKFDLKEGYIDYVLDNFSYEIQDNLLNATAPKILNCYDSIELLLKTPMSFCRIGDGELELMSGNSIAFQRYNNELSQYLNKILKYDIENVLVGLPEFYFKSTGNLNMLTKQFIRAVGSKYQKQILDNMDNEKVYIDTSISQVYQVFNKMNFEKYYTSVKRIFQNKRITVICGADIFENINYYIFEDAVSVEYVYAPSKNAYECYNEILEKALCIDKNRIICIVLGPTSKVLVCELTKHSYIAWDIGHLVKDYDSYKKRLPRDSNTIINFYKPD